MDEISKILQQMQERLISIFMEISGQGTTDEVIQIISRLDLTDIINENKQAVTSALRAGYEAELLKVAGITGTVTEEVLQAFVDVQSATFFSYVDDMAASVRAETITGILTGVGSRNIGLAVAGKAISPAQMETLINTSLNTFSAQVNATIGQFVPEAKYVYIGPIDEKTRDICLQFASLPPMTMDEINSSYPGAFVDRGGFNCRHQWERVQPENVGHDVDRANQFINDRGDKFKPVTLLETLKEKAA
jgi:hypothetical protein